MPLLYYLCTLLTLPGLLLASGVSETLYTTGKGLEEAYIYTINQDSSGYLWLGTGNGLIRYDGRYFENVTADDTLAGRFITSTLIYNDEVWTGSMDGRLSRYQHQQIETLELPESWKTKITALQLSPDSRIWASLYNRGFVQYAPSGTVDTLPIPQSFSNLNINDFVITPNKQLLIASSNGLYSAAPPYIHWEPIPATSELRFMQILPGSQTHSYVLSTRYEGIYQLNYTETGCEINRLDSTWDGALSSVQAIHYDQQDRLWLATFGDGLWFSQENKNGNFTLPTQVKLPQTGIENVNSIFQDNQGVLWAGAYGKGLLSLATTPYQFSSSRTLPNNTVNALFTSGTYLWMGTGKGVVGHPLQCAVAAKDSLNFLNQYPITALCEVDSTLWVGTAADGVFRYDIRQKQFDKYFLASGKPENHITSIKYAEDKLWIGTVKGLCRINLNDDSRKWFSISRGGLPNNRIMDLLPDVSGSWVVTRGATISRVEKDTVINHPIATGSSGYSLNALAKDSQNRLWVGTLGGGLFYLKDKGFVRIGMEDGLHSNYCYSVIADSDNNIWVSHKGAVSRIHASSKHIVTILVDKNSSKGEFNNNAVTATRNDQLWMGLSDGILFIDASQITRYGDAPNLHMHQVRVNGMKIDHTSKTVLPPGHYQLDFEFASINQSSPELIQFEYTLAGYSDTLQRTNLDAVSFPNLSHGKYHLQVQAIGPNGEKSAPLYSAEIKIRISIWKSPWFYAISLSTLFLSLLIYINRQRKLMWIRTLQLERKVKERTEEIAQKNRQLGQQNTQLELQKEELKEANATKDKFFSIIAHDLKNPLNSMVGFSSLLETEYDQFDDEERKSYINIINQSSNGLNSLLNNLLDWSRIQTGRVVYDPDNFTVDDVVFPILEVQRSAALNKNIIIHDFTQSDAFLFGDQRMIHTVLQNLVSNAIKFTNTNGNVYLETEDLGDRVKLTVRDDGVGISPENQEKLFGIDKSYSTSGTSGESGTGLGLTLCKEFVEKHGSRIIVSSILGAGTAFSFVLPKGSQ